MTAHTCKHLVHSVICSALIWIRKKYEILAVSSQLIYWKCKETSFFLSFLISKTFLNKEWNNFYSKARCFLLNLFQNWDNAANAGVRDDPGHVILLPFHLFWGEIVTTKLKQALYPRSFGGFTLWFISRSGSAYQELTHTLLCSLRVRLDCTACLYKTHSAKQSWQWAVLLISHVCTNTAFLRGRFPDFKGGNDCTSDHCRCALRKFGYHKLRPNSTTPCMQCTESQGGGKIPFYHYCSKDLRSSQGQ